MSKITFTNFEISDGYISFHYKEELVGEGGTIYFELVPGIRPKTDLIAIAISTLCARKYTSIHYDLQVSNSTVSAISKFTLANVTAKESLDNNIHRKRRNNVTLNFSGGFDSLAAKCLMPDDTSLVSMDFGGRFSREKTFFEKFDTYIVRTNLLETPLKDNTWSFMGIASILYSDYLGTDYQTFGSILEAGPNNFSDAPIAAKNVSFPPFKMAGMENAPYVLGLTEVGTLNVLGHHSPELIAESLDSLATPGEEKRYRKQVLSQIASNKIGINFGLNIIDRPARPHFKFGQNFAADFLSFYVIKNIGIEIASHTISEIPEEVQKLADKLNLDFYERVNPNFLVNFPKPLLAGLLSKLAEADVFPYTQKDWEEFYEIRNLLSIYYSI
ncbi:hypothetical protein KHA93_13405 [Bacillus sp. FJAT-49732]|uniref:Uncharacterized protein n=1 Tax=Lederbergia citrisecunda TaxID=2833583 RepID=A0A942YLQ5_9BACI|nr:hypothetical protein [Lederbergia citrisecunda]MBS4200629.1 hypothetical protein [Lederbergia citrisecunda]